MPKVFVHAPRCCSIHFCLCDLAFFGFFVYQISRIDCLHVLYRLRLRVHRGSIPGRKCHVVNTFFHIYPVLFLRPLTAVSTPPPPVNPAPHPLVSRPRPFPLQPLLMLPDHSMVRHLASQVPLALVLSCRGPQQHHINNTYSEL